MVGAAATAATIAAIKGIMSAVKAKKARQEKRKAKRKAAKQFQKDWKSKKRKQVAAEKDARANIESANLQSQTISQVSDDAVLSGMMDAPAGPSSSSGGSQLDRFEQKYFR